MKTFNQLIVLFVMAFAVTGTFTSCSKDDDGGEPKINYVRVTNPNSSDSLLVGAGQGKLIAIMGENLGGAIEIEYK